MLLAMLHPVFAVCVRQPQHIIVVWACSIISLYCGHFLCWLWGTVSTFTAVVVQFLHVPLNVVSMSMSECRWVNVDDVRMLNSKRVNKTDTRIIIIIQTFVTRTVSANILNHTEWLRNPAFEALVCFWSRLRLTGWGDRLSRPLLP